MKLFKKILLRIIIAFLLIWGFNHGIRYLYYPNKLRADSLELDVEYLKESQLNYLKELSNYIFESNKLFNINFDWIRTHIKDGNKIIIVYHYDDCNTCIDDLYSLMNQREFLSDSLTEVVLFSNYRNIRDFKLKNKTINFNTVNINLDSIPSNNYGIEKPMIFYLDDTFKVSYPLIFDPYHKTFNENYFYLLLNNSTFDD